MVKRDLVAKQDRELAERSRLLSREVERGRSIARLDGLYGEAMARGDHRGALAVERERIRLLGLAKVGERDGMVELSEVRSAWGAVMGTLMERIGEALEEEGLAECFRSGRRRRLVRARVEAVFGEALRTFDGGGDGERG